MTELEAVSLLELLQASPGRAPGSRIQQLGNGDHVVVVDGLYIWCEQDAKRWMKGSLQKALARKLKKEAVAT